MAYCTGSHTKFYHRYHIVWVTKYRFKVLHGDMRVRLREIIRQTCSEMGVRIEKGVLSNDHVHMFVSIRVDPTAPGAVDGDAADQGALIPQNPDGVPGPAQTILGQAVLGPWIFLDHIRQCD